MKMFILWVVELKGTTPGGVVCRFTEGEEGRLIRDCGVTLLFAQPEGREFTKKRKLKGKVARAFIKLRQDSVTPLYPARKSHKFQLYLK